MSSHESTPSGSREIKISRRGVLTGLFAGAGAAALAACGESKPKPGPTPEVIPSPKPIPPSPSVEATPSKTPEASPSPSPAETSKSPEVQLEQVNEWVMTTKDVETFYEKWDSMEPGDRILYVREWMAKQPGSDFNKDNMVVGALDTGASAQDVMREVVKQLNIITMVAADIEFGKTLSKGEKDFAAKLLEGVYPVSPDSEEAKDAMEIIKSRIYMDEWQYSEGKITPEDYRKVVCHTFDNLEFVSVEETSNATEVLFAMKFRVRGNDNPKLYSSNEMNWNKELMADMNIAGVLRSLTNGETLLSF